MMRRILALIGLGVLSCAAPAYAQFQPPNFLVNCSTSATNPTYVAGVVNPCSQTTAGEIRVTLGSNVVSVTPSGPFATETIITNTPNVQVENLGPTDSSTYAATPCYHVTTAAVNTINCKTSAGNFYGVVRAINTTATIAYLRLYNLAAAPTCSSATGFIESIPIPPYAAAGGAGGIAVPELIPTHFSAGIGFCVTGGGTSTDNTATVAGIYLKLLLK